MSTSFSWDLIDHFCPKGQFQVKKQGEFYNFLKKNTAVTGIGYKKELTYLQVKLVPVFVVLGMYKI